MPGEPLYKYRHAFWEKTKTDPRAEIRKYWNDETHAKRRPDVVGHFKHAATRANKFWWNAVYNPMVNITIVAAINILSIASHSCALRKCLPTFGTPPTVSGRLPVRATF